MKIKMTLSYINYDSRIARFISICKSSFGGFVAWVGLWMFIFMIAMGITGGDVALAIIIGILCIATYISLFFIDEDKIERRRNNRMQEKMGANSAPKKSIHNKSKPTPVIKDANGIIHPDACAEKFIDYCQNINVFESGLGESWNKDIAEFFPLSTDYAMNVWLYRQILLSTALPCKAKGNLRDQDYHICHSRYAILDFSILAYLYTRIFLSTCAERRDVERTDTLFFNLLVKYFEHHFDLPETETNNILNDRLQAYENTMRSIDWENLEENLLSRFLQFVTRDFSGKPMSKPLFILGADKQLSLFKEASSLLGSYYKIYKKHPAPLPFFIDENEIERRQNNSMQEKMNAKVAPKSTLENTQSSNNSDISDKPSYFFGLFDKLAYLKKSGIHNYIDYIIYALFKSRLVFINEVLESDMPEQRQSDVVGLYDVDMFLSFGIWMDKNAPQFVEKTKIIDSRIVAYEKTFSTFSESFFVFSMLTSTLHHFLENGWAKDSNGNFSTVHTDNFDISCLKGAAAKWDAKYAPITDEMDTTVLEYCDKELRKYLENLKAEVH